ncbi:hypothetical protein GCM10027290_10050 [Micromonospora sonneratiae]|uniref:LPXTG cell wall anchor domain-containing protein n=1 Tax=Micromonospora sonneratiae TaxID=1184706 RepID=A0ABW3YJY7_9ACTN
MSQGLRRRLTATIVTAAGIAGALAASSSPAFANSTTPLHQTNVTAGDAEQKCGDERFAGRPKDHDGWHFVLPGGNASGDFVELNLDFVTGSGQTVSVKIPDATDAYPDAFYKAGGRTIHAYLFTPAGWTLKDGSAEITGTAKFFNLSHACEGTPGTPATGTPTPGTPTPGTPSPGPTDSGTPGPSTSVPGEGGGLPITGAPVAGIAAVGAGLVGVGALLLVLRRRREAESS